MDLKAIVGATVIDGTGRPPVRDATVILEDGRVLSVTPAAHTTVPEQAEVIDAAGRYVVPGLMDANVHLASISPPELMIQLEGRYSEAVEEAAQIALRSGLTTVFDTWGPLKALTQVRDQIDRGALAGSRMFVAGNIIGLPGPISDEFHFRDASIFMPETVERINGYWEQGVGQDLQRLPAEEVGRRVREYIARSNVNFIKYAASGHAVSRMQYIAFSERAQRAIVEEAHSAGLTAQAHTSSPESLRMEIEAGADILQHPDSTGRVPMPEDTLETIVERRLPCAALVCTQRFYAWSADHLPEVARAYYNETQDENDRRLIAAGAKLLLTTDGHLNHKSLRRHPLVGPFLEAQDYPQLLGEGHFLWLEAVTERGMAPMDALLAATRNIAEAYGQDAELGTLEPGKRADLLILEADPLEDVHNYRRIVEVMKDGALVDRNALPTSPVLTEARTTGADAGNAKA